MKGNYVAKNMHKFNRPATHENKKHLQKSQPEIEDNSGKCLYCDSECATIDPNDNFGVCYECCRQNDNGSSKESSV